MAIHSILMFAGGFVSAAIVLAIGDYLDAMRNHRP